MLINTIKETINILDQLIKISKENIENIKEANHNEVFKNTKIKEELAYKFSNLKNEIDNILVSRNRPLEEIFTDEEEKLFNEFREKLFEFNKLHKKFSKLALSVANFYNTLLKQIKQEENVNYSQTYQKSNLQLKA